MPSPFPGMDPFIESQKWSDFHTSFIAVLRERLLPAVRPKYIVDIEERVYLERDPDDPVMILRPDVAVIDSGRTEPVASAAAAPAAAPVECLLPMPEEAREVYLTIRRKDQRTVVTVIELLSPANKRPGASGFEQYLERRERLLASSANLVELDVLRGGRHTPVLGELPAGDYRAIIGRASRRPRAEVYVWRLDQRLPVIPIPMGHPDPDVRIDLQDVFDLVYDRAGYDYSLDYGAVPAPALDPARVCWAEKILRETKDASS